ncbi:MAG: sulfatase-like hydrolase/transferase [Saprospiraceae bacterium]|nr:sulfatase-like hydrolase/transferase [Saprospiraceae bacterium]
MMQRLIYWLLTFMLYVPAVHGLVQGQSHAGTRNSPPNIVFILADDAGWNEIGFNSDTNDYTPNIDALRREGTSFTNFYAHAVCAPTRAAFLTGRYPFRTWTDWRSEDFGKPSYLDMLGLTVARNAEGEETRMIHGLDTEEKTIAEALANEGYFTAITGKWHCGEWLDEHLPMGQGFMHQYGHYAWGIDYTNYSIPHNAPAKFAVYDWHRNQQPIYEQGYTTDLIANEVVQLLSTHDALHGDQPFFYYVPFNAIHGPLEEIPRYVDQLGKRYAALKCLDDAIGRIVGALDQYGHAQQTLLIFTNDNGGIRQNMNAPYRGTKNTNYEGGVRVPCVMRWPGHIKKNSSNDALMHIIDLYNTFIAIAGGEIAQDRMPDGIDMSQTILSGQGPGRKEIVFEVKGSVRTPCIRQGDYKLIGEELFNIREDPFEQLNIAGDHPQIVQTLRQRIEEISAERPSLPSLDKLMSPALPWVYGQAENANAPAWLQEHITAIRAKQPQSWPPGTTPWPQAPKDGKIIYTGDGR